MRANVNQRVPRTASSTGEGIDQRIPSVGEGAEGKHLFQAVAGPSQIKGRTLPSHPFSSRFGPMSGGVGECRPGACAQAPIGVAVDLRNARSRLVPPFSYRRVIICVIIKIVKSDVADDRHGCNWAPNRSSEVGSARGRLSSPTVERRCSVQQQLRGRVLEDDRFLWVQRFDDCLHV